MPELLSAVPAQGVPAARDYAPDAATDLAAAQDGAGSFLHLFADRLQELTGKQDGLAADAGTPSLNSPQAPHDGQVLPLSLPFAAPSAAVQATVTDTEAETPASDPATSAVIPIINADAGGVTGGSTDISALASDAPAPALNQAAITPVIPNVVSAETFGAIVPQLHGGVEQAQARLPELAKPAVAVSGDGASAQLAAALSEDALQAASVNADLPDHSAAQQERKSTSEWLPLPTQPQTSAAPAVAGASTSYANAAANASSNVAIPVPLQQPGWDDALGQRMVWLVKQDVHAAELRINPPQLGPLEMRVTISNTDQASVAFSAPHAAVRDALEAAVPRLRDLFSAGGLNLMDVSVSQHSFAEQRQAQSYPAPGRGAFNDDIADGATNNGRGGAAPIVRPLSLVDVYA
ncbi:MAG: flagellar hook-length control protein FliK [Pseudomonadota bacterium]